MHPAVLPKFLSQCGLVSVALHVDCALCVVVVGHDESVPLCMEMSAASRFIFILFTAVSFASRAALNSAVVCARTPGTNALRTSAHARAKPTRRGGWERARMAAGRGKEAARRDRGSV